MIGTIIASIIVGLIIGALGRLLVPGKQNISIIVTIIIGIVANLIVGWGLGAIFGYSNSNGNDYGMPHCESAPAGGLFQQELAALRKLGGPEGARGIDALLAGSFHSGSDSLEDMYPGLGRTVHGADYIQRYLQLLCALEGGHGPVTP